MKKHNARIVSILSSTLRTVTKSSALVVPMSTALLLGGCAEFPTTPERDWIDESAEEPNMDGDYDQLAGQEAEASLSDEDVVVQVPLENLSLDDGDEAPPNAELDVENQDFQDLPSAQTDAILDSDFDTDGAGTTSTFSTCASTTTACSIGGKLGTRLACGADFFAVMFGQVELVGPLSYSCYAALFGTAGTCIAASGFCGGVVDTIVSPPGDTGPKHRVLQEDAGTDYSTDTEKSAKCPGHERAKKVTVWKWNDSLKWVSKVQLECTDGTKVDFGTANSGDLAGGMACDQSKGKLVSGLRVRHGGYIDAVGARCQSAGFADVATKSEFPVTNFSTWGGDGGTLETFECPKHQYLRGMEAHFTKAYGKNVISYMQLHCR